MTQVRRNAFINKIRDLGFRYKSETQLHQMFKKSGSTQHIFVPRRDLLEDDFVKHSLRQAGCSEADVKAFIASAKA